MLEGVDGHRRARSVWFLSPALATVLFFGAQLLIATVIDSPGVRVAKSAASPPSPVPVKVRVVTQIRDLEEKPRELARVPQSEAALLELFKKNGCVVFSASEVDAVGTQERRFGTEEVGVITAESKLRAARFVR
jgi:hypothetical protein